MKNNIWKEAFVEFVDLFSDLGKMFWERLPLLIFMLLLVFSIFWSVILIIEVSWWFILNVFPIVYFLIVAVIYFDGKEKEL